MSDEQLISRTLAALAHAQGPDAQAGVLRDFAAEIRKGATYSSCPECGRPGVVCAACWAKQQAEEKVIKPLASKAVDWLHKKQQEAAGEGEGS